MPTNGCPPIEGHDRPLDKLSNIPLRKESQVPSVSWEILNGASTELDSGFYRWGDAFFAGESG